MKVKKIIALFCLLFIGLQALPVKQLGAILFNNQITEDIAHASDDGKKQTAENFTDNYLPVYYDSYAHQILGTNNHTTHGHFPLVQLHVAEVQTPPPNDLM
jgi:hypothetical protein